MPTNLNKPMEAAVAEAKNALYSSINNADIRLKAEEVGYDAAEIDKGLDYVTQAERKMREKTDWEGEIYNATIAEAEAKKAAVKAYQDLAKIARAKWKPRSPELIKLGLVGTMPAATDSFIAAAYLLLENIKNNSEILDYFHLRNITDVKLDEFMGKIKVYETANTFQNSLIGEMTAKINNQMSIINALSAWYQEFKEIMKATLTIAQQKSIGIIERTTRTKAQKQAGKKQSATKKAKKNT